MEWGKTYAIGMGDGDLEGIFASATGVEGWTETVAKPSVDTELEVKH